MPDNTEREAIAQAVREELERISAGTDKKEPVAQSAINLTIDGKQYSYANQQELENALGQTFRAVGQEVENLRSQITQKPAEGQYVSGKEGEKFSQEKYVDLMTKGPEGILEAHRYAMNHAIFNGTAPDAADRIRQSLEKSTQTDATLAVYQFRELHPEFPMTPESTKAIDAIRQELRQPFSLQGLEAAYGVAQSRGIVPSPQLIAYQQKIQQQGLDPATFQQIQSSQGPPPPGGSFNAQNFNGGLGFAPPPGVSRTTAAPVADWVRQAENLTLEQLEPALKKAGLL